MLYGHRMFDKKIGQPYVALTNYEIVALLHSVLRPDSEIDTYQVSWPPGSQ